MLVSRGTASGHGSSNPALAAPARVAAPVTLADEAGPWPALSLSVPEEIATQVCELAEFAYGEHSTLLRGRLVANGRSIIVKCMRGPRDDLLMNQLAATTNPYLVATLAMHRENDRWWQVMEECPHGTVHDLIVANPAGLDAYPVIMITRHVAEALSALHRRGIVHLDITPANLLVSDLEPLCVAVGDLGSAALVGACQADLAKRVRATPGYGPHSDEAVGPARDWWGLGMVIATAAVGHNPLLIAEITDPRAPTMAEIDAFLASHDVPLDGIGDAHLALGARGLLARDPAERWGRDQVVAWCQGESPPAAAPLARPGSPVRVAYAFAGHLFSEPAELGGALVERWEAANALVTGNGLPELVRWLMPTHHAERVREMYRRWQGSAMHPARVVCELIGELAPDIEPVFGVPRVPLTAPGLEALARACLKGDEQARDCVAELFDSGALLVWAAVRDRPELATLHARWAEVEAVTSRLIGEVNADIVRAGERLTSDMRSLHRTYRLPDDVHEVSVAGAARAVVLAEILGSLVSDGFAAELRWHAVKAATGPALGEAWFARLVQLGEPHGARMARGRVRSDREWGRKA